MYHPAFSWQGRAISKKHIFSRPTGVTYGTAMRAFDLKTQEWAIWWIDSRFLTFRSTHQ